MDGIDRQETGEPEPGGTENGDEEEEAGGVPAAGDRPEDDTLLRESPDPPITE
jgi:hypothetical protein